MEEWKYLKELEIQDIKNTFIDKPCFQHNIVYGDFKDLPI